MLFNSRGIVRGQTETSWPNLSAWTQSEAVNSTAADRRRFCLDKMSLSKETSPRRERGEIPNESWMWKVKTQHSRGTKLMLASFLPTEIWCVWGRETERGREIHLIFTLIYLKICPFTFNCVKAGQPIPAIPLFSQHCDYNSKPHVDSDEKAFCVIGLCSVSPLSAPTDSHKILCNVPRHTRSR